MAEQLHVLCVDDEPKVLEGLVLNLRRHYRVSTAGSGPEGLLLVGGADPPAVVVSDMRMPGMDGAAFLGQVKERWPNIVRLLLTGQADLDSAIAAVNQGQVFRFLTKPCNSQSFLTAIAAAAEQYRLITAEKDLLEKTLRGSIKALTEVLSLANPLIFGRATRLKQHAAELVTGLGVPFSWQLEIAVTLSQIGCIVLTSANNEKLYYGRPLTREEEESTQCVSKISLQLLESIPRLELVCAILDAQELNFDGQGSPNGAPRGEAIPLGARVLKLISDYDFLEAGGTSSGAAISTLQGRKGRYDPKLIGVLGRVKSKTTPGVREVKLADLQTGMLLFQDVMSTTGSLLVPRGHEIAEAILTRLRGMEPGSVREPLMVLGS
jgi:response regulator RpfG family c-di-GMP phosphodiesterase